MSLGKKIRLNRIFAHPSGRLCSVAIDHLLGYDAGMPPGLRHFKQTLAAVVAGMPDAVTIHKGMAAACWEPYAGRLPLILQSSGVRPDDSALEDFATLEEAVRLGADAIAVVVYVRGASEAAHLRRLADYVRESPYYELPIICHVYPRTKQMQISYTPEDIAWAVRCVNEIGADVVKVPYCGDLVAHTQIVTDCTTPIVAAGGPKTDTFEAALQLMADVVASGALGGTIGRNIWGHGAVTAALRAFKLVIHNRVTPAEAMRQAGIKGD
jgi:class I fructose-bisphosphate aldolase